MQTMQSIIVDAAIDMTQASSLAELINYFQKYIEHFGFDSFTYLHTRYDINKQQQDMPFLSTYSQAWQTEYIQEGYVNKDPVIRYGYDALVPFKWHDISRTSDHVMAAAQDYNCGYGLTVPIHGRYGELALLSTCGPKSTGEVDKLAQEYLPYIHFLAFYLHQQAKGLFDTPTTDIHIHLSPRENDVLAWTAQGKSSWEIGQILGLAERTVNQYIHSCYRKLEVHNKHHCVAKALVMGLISL
jgi:DNA-binding CsgD family transcriptional regulator